MTAEGVFPKVAGDIAYASEANKFNPKILDTFFTTDVPNTSGTTAFVTCGSVLYTGGANQISSFMILQATMYPDETSTSYSQARLRISGTAGLNFNTTTRDYGDDIKPIMTWNHVFTSGAITSSGGNVGSSYLITIEANNRSATTPMVLGEVLLWGH